MSAQTIEVKFDVSGSVNQEIEFCPGHEMTVEDFLAAYRRGDVITSIGHGPNNGCVYLLPDFVQIGRVISQEANDDLEISLTDWITGV